MGLHRTDARRSNAPSGTGRGKAPIVRAFDHVACMDASPHGFTKLLFFSWILHGPSLTALRMPSRWANRRRQGRAFSSCGAETVCQICETVHEAAIAAVSH